MQLTVNGEQIELPEQTTLASLIESKGLAGKPCAAELNRSVVPHREHASTVLSEGDTVELVTLVGGG